MNHTRHFWNLLSGIICLAFLALILLTGSNSFGDSLISASGTPVFDLGEIPESAERDDRFIRPAAFPLAAASAPVIEVGSMLSPGQLKQLDPVPALISRRYHSPGGQCFFRFHEGRVVIIHKGSNRVLDIEASQVLIEL
ncbi:MAG: hypothetical protein P1U86_09295 [Verrucomicrobiales bacterium]|nr:hypothetical protein [Verrucomicrobiales bacterium]